MDTTPLDGKPPAGLEPPKRCPRCGCIPFSGPYLNRGLGKSKKNMGKWYHQCRNCFLALHHTILSAEDEARKKADEDARKKADEDAKRTKTAAEVEYQTAKDLIPKKEREEKAKAVWEAAVQTREEYAAGDELDDEVLQELQKAVLAAKEKHEWRARLSYECADRLRRKAAGVGLRYENYELMYGDFPAEGTSSSSPLGSLAAESSPSTSRAASSRSRPSDSSPSTLTAPAPPPDRSDTKPTEQGSSNERITSRRWPPPRVADEIMDLSSPPSSPSPAARASRGMRMTTGGKAPRKVQLEAQAAKDDASRSSKVDETVAGGKRKAVDDASAGLAAKRPRQAGSLPHNVIGGSMTAPLSEKARGKQRAEDSDGDDDGFGIDSGGSEPQMWPSSATEENEALEWALRESSALVRSQEDSRAGPSTSHLPRPKTEVDDDEVEVLDDLDDEGVLKQEDGANRAPPRATPHVPRPEVDDDEVEVLDDLDGAPPRESRHREARTSTMAAAMSGARDGSGDGPGRQGAEPVARQLAAAMSGESARNGDRGTTTRTSLDDDVRDDDGDSDVVITGSRSMQWRWIAFYREIVGRGTREEPVMMKISVVEPMTLRSHADIGEIREYMGIGQSESFRVWDANSCDWVTYGQDTPLPDEVFMVMKKRSVGYCYRFGYYARRAELGYLPAPEDRRRAAEFR
ncbi:hypothetical protein PsYK624_091290 [Phanerochaete sordida]|uniref:Uncharacterized protein n=1 Tax=Phanerochaete sordida TaxID=48140 RepID=A0A9P3GFV4_9APHY|nr:hypothetical protein PsYK624_091290 [Phanerochaete sordida]